MEKNYEELFQRIRARCRQQRWHGPDIYNPIKIVERMRKTDIPIGIMKQTDTRDMPNVIRTWILHQVVFSGKKREKMPISSRARRPRSING